MFPELLLDKRLLKSVQMLKYQQPTEVQAVVIPKIVNGIDLLVSASTGTGKTAAYLLPTLQRMLDNKGENAGTRTLILAPTRELAQQIVKNCQSLARYTHIKVGLITGGADFKYQKSMLRRDPEFIVGTPGRLLEHITKMSTDFGNLESLIIDEADRMLDMGFNDDVMRICDSCGNAKQRLMFSATLNNRAVNEFAAKVMDSPEKISIGNKRGQSESIRQQIVLADNDMHKEKLVAWLVENEPHTKALIFTKTRKQASRVCGILRGKKHKVNVLHGEIKQDERNETMGMFRSGRISLLVATDVAARGLDINDVDLVINFGLPGDGDDYVHRIGRTGRAGSVGNAISFVAPEDWNSMISLERYLQISFERRQIKSLQGHFKGPKKLKSSGKISSKKKKSSGRVPAKKVSGKTTPNSKAGTRKKVETRENDTSTVIDGFAPFKKKSK